jgi:hypothetical protein
MGFSITQEKDLYYSIVTEGSKSNLSSRSNRRVSLEKIGVKLSSDQLAKEDLV